MSQILLDIGAREELARLCLDQERPDGIEPLVWRLILAARLAAVEMDALGRLTDLVGPDLIYRLREASERAATVEEVVP